jgi:hypothetical protein
MLQYGSAVTTTPEFWADVKVFEVKAWLSDKRREVGEEHGKADGFVPFKG